MRKNQPITVIFHGKEVGKLGMNEDAGTTSFQYNPDFLKEDNYKNLFPYIFRKTPFVQNFNQFGGNTYRMLPPMIADSLPDSFGNTVFNQWWIQNKKGKELNALEQLAYVSNRGMGALEYHPSKELPSLSSVSIEEIAEIAQRVMEVKQSTVEERLDDISLYNIFKLGTSAGGARPKILVSENQKTGKLIPGDIAVSENYNHYIVKLEMPGDYSKSKVEYLYYEIAQEGGIDIMPSKLIENKHFATLRFDRQNGKKQHVLTVSGLTGWDYQKPDNSSYENIFKLALDLKVCHKDLEQLFRRMVFNLIFTNFDDHLKNFSFLFDEEKNAWSLAPAYDLTFPGEALLHYKKINHAASVNGKRNNFKLEDVLKIADEYSISNPIGIIAEIQNLTPSFIQKAKALDLPNPVTDSITSKFIIFIEN